jgi:hypothetical protein
MNHWRCACVLVCVLPSVLLSQSLGARRTHPALIAGSATLGVAVGAVAGAFIGGAATTRSCNNGPDDCLGQAFPGFIWGAGIGSTVGAPAGASLANRGRGNVLLSLAASTAIFGAEVVALRSIVHDGRTMHADAARGIVITAPVLQIVTSTLLELRTRR